MFGVLALVAGLGLLVIGVRAGLGFGSAAGAARPRLHPTIRERTARWAQTVRAEGHPAVEPSLLLGVIARESGGNENAAGSASEVGLMQLSKAAVQDYMAETADPDVVDLASVEVPQVNIRVGSWYLARKIEEMGSRYEGLRAYNCGTVGARRNPTCGAEYARWILEVAEPEFRTATT